MISSSLIHVMESNSSGVSELQSTAFFLQRVCSGIRNVLLLKQK